MVTALGRLPEVSPSPSIRSTRSIDSPIRLGQSGQSQGTSPLRARMDAAELTSLRRDLTRANERIRELQQSEKDAHLKLRVKDDLLKRLHEELKEKSNASQVAFEKEIELFQVQVAQKDADLRRADETILLMKTDNVRLAEINRSAQHAITEAEGRAAAVEAKVAAEVYEIQHQLEQQKIAYDRLMEQAALAAKEASARDSESVMRISRLEHENKILDERLQTAQEAARLHESKAMTESLRQAESDRKLHDFEAILSSLRGEINAQKELEKDLEKSKETNQQLKEKVEELTRSSALSDIKLSEQQRAIEKGKELERELEAKRNEEREHTTDARNRIAELEVRVAALTKELDDAKAKLRMHADEATEAENSKTIARMKADEDRLAREEEVAYLHERIRAATERVTRVETEKANAESELQRLRTVEVALKEDIKSLKAKEATMQALLDTERSNFKRALDEVTAEKKSILAQSDAERVALRREISEGATRVMNAESMLGEVTAQAEKAAAQLEQEREMNRLAANDRAVEHRLKMDRAQLRISELENELELTLSKLEQATNDYEHQREDAARSREVDRQRHEAHIKELQARHSANLLNQDDAAAKAANAEHQAAYLAAQVAELNDEMEHMRVANQRSAALLEAERTSRQQELLANKEKVSSVARQLLDAQNEIAQKENQLQRAGDAQQTLRAELDIIQDAYESLKNQMDKERDEHRRSQGASAEDRRRDALKIVELKQALEERGRDLSDQRVQHRVLEGELEEERKRLSLLQERYENGLRSKETAMMDEQDRQTVARKRLAEDIHRLESENEALRDEKIKLHDELIAKGKEMVLKNEETESLSSQLRDAKARAGQVALAEAEADELRAEKASRDAKEAALQSALVSVHSGMKSLSTQINALNNENAKLKEQLSHERATVAELVSATLQES